MSDGWESPDEESVLKIQPVVSNYSKSTNSQSSNGDADDSGWGEMGRTFFRGRGGSNSGGRGDGRGRGRGRGGNWSGDDRGNGNGRQENSWRNERPQRGDEGDSWGQDDRSGGGRGRGGFGKPRYSDEESMSIEIPTSMVGKVIGRGGSKISELQTESNARIQVTKEENDNNTIIKLNGSEENMQKAKSLIEELISERRPMNNYSDSSMNGSVGNRHPPNITINWKEVSDECDRSSREKWAKCPPLIKNFYTEHPSVTSLSEDEVSVFREQNNNIVVSRIFSEKQGYKPIPNPVQTFEQCFQDKHPDILQEIVKMGFEKPSPIQCQAWPVLLGGDDLIGIAQTGTGKTLAFLLPALIHIEGQPVPRGQRGGPNVLVMAPTRELALQIEKEVKKYNYRGIKAVCVYGGGSRRDQVSIVTAGVEIVIATPGRLNDLVQAGYIDVSTITYLVLDEADRMLDMGFEPQIRKILLDIRPDRQTVMTSATWPPGVRRLAESYMDNPVQVYVGSLDLAAVHSVMQTILILEDDEEEKFRTFLNWVNTMEPDDKVIVFCGKKARADFVAMELLTLGIDCQSIHGDREQVDREQALVDIASGLVQILVATDVASRGIDIQDISHVINYDFPRNVEEYVHRVGRTGRAGRTGESISYFTRADWGNARELIAILEEANQYVPEELHGMAKRFEVMKAKKDLEKGSRGGGRFGGGGRGGGGKRW